MGKSPLHRALGRARPDLQAFVTGMRRAKLPRRARRQKGEPAAADLATIERRAASALVEMRMAPAFEPVIPNHDGEDSDHGELEHPVGDARRALRALAALLEGAEAEGVERWEAGLLDSPAGPAD